VGRCNPYFGGCGSPEDFGGKGGLLSQSRYGNAPDRMAGCEMERMMVSCDLAQAFVASGAAYLKDRSYISPERRRDPIPGQADAPKPNTNPPGSGGGTTTALAFWGGSGGGGSIIIDGGNLGSVTTTDYYDPPVVGDGMIVGGVLHLLYNPQQPIRASLTDRDLMATVEPL
jgi:hypothetical protein